MLELGCTRVGITETGTFRFCLANYSALIKITRKIILQIVSVCGWLELVLYSAGLKHAALLKAWTFKNRGHKGLYSFLSFLPIHHRRKKKNPNKSLIDACCFASLHAFISLCCLLPSVFPDFRDASEEAKREMKLWPCNIFQIHIHFAV